MADEVKHLTVNPLLFMAVAERVEADNPEAAAEGVVAHILITAANGYAPHILSTVSPKDMDEIIDWLVAHRDRRGTDMPLDGLGTGTIQ